MFDDLVKEVQELTNNNNHTQSLIVIAEFFAKKLKCPTFDNEFDTAKVKLEAIQFRSKKNGYLGMEDYDKRNSIMKFLLLWVRDFITETERRELYLSL